MTYPAMSLRNLVFVAGDSMQLRGDDVSISGLAYDSRVVQPGDLFFCIPGNQQDGHDFAAEALNRGAKALLVERWLPFECPQVLSESVRQDMGHISATYFALPLDNMSSKDITMVGVTGTNGKTTVCWLLHSILTAAGQNTKVLGTLSGALTTPESVDLHRQLAQWRYEGVQAVVMEVSSHALQQHRVAGICYDLAIFTNLSVDHLDYHGNLHNYFSAKARLFTPKMSKRALVNSADRYGQRLAVQSATTSVYTPDTVDAQTTLQGITMWWRGHEVSVTLLGRFNCANILAAAEAALLLGVKERKVVAALESVKPVPGRFELVPTTLPITVIVDYAHTPDALAKVLVSARELLGGRGKLRVVFGCGGERDTAKRPEMGRIASELSDHMIVTSDNPRSEDPEAIIAAILAGASGSAVVEKEVDRCVGIARCLQKASHTSTRRDSSGPSGSSEADFSNGDLVIIAGKGHETTQIIGNKVLPFDDRLVAKEVLAELEAQQ